MKYLEEVLLSGEILQYECTISNWIYCRPVIILVIGLFIMLAGSWGQGVLFVIFVVSCIPLVNAFINKRTNELGFTDQRVIGKTGWISRHVVELALDKVASFEVKQGLIGRMLRYGTVLVRDTGGTGTAPFKYLENPTDLSRAHQQFLADR